MGSTGGRVPATEAFSAVASAASPPMMEDQVSSTPLRLPLGTSLKPSGEMASVYLSPLMSSSRLNAELSLVVMAGAPVLSRREWAFVLNRPAIRREDSGRCALRTLLVLRARPAARWRSPNGVRGLAAIGLGRRRARDETGRAADHGPSQGAGNGPASPF